MSRAKNVRRLLLAALVLATVTFTAQASTTPIVYGRSVWKYLDNGTNQGTAWREPGFDDSAWAAGWAELGYGEGDEATHVGYGIDPLRRYVTTYFRQTFAVANPALLSQLTLRMIRDDGAVVYVNGTEVWRVNMPTGAISSLTDRITPWRSK